MKKLIAIISAIVLLVGTATIGVSAVTKADLFAEAAKSPAYKYVQVAIENAARTVEVTPEQAEQILPIVKRACEIIGNDEHPSAFSDEHGLLYTKEQINGVMACIDEICEIMRFTYKMVPVANPEHAGDGMLTVYDANGKVVFQYDGDAVADTDAATSMDTALLFAGAGIMLALGAAAIAVSKKRMAAELAE